MIKEEDCYFLVLYLLSKLKYYYYYHCLIFRGPKFELVTKGSLTLADADDTVRTYDLTMEPTAGKEFNSQDFKIYLIWVYYLSSELR